MSKMFGQLLGLGLLSTIVTSVSSHYVFAGDAELLARLNELANLARFEKYETVDDKDTVIKFSEIKPAWILYSSDQKAGKSSTAKLAAIGPEKLQKAGVLVVANVRPIPFFIKPIVYSKLRSSAFRTVLNKDESVFDLVETKEAELTVLKLNWSQKLIIESVSHWNPEKEAAPKDIALP